MKRLFVPIAVAAMILTSCKKYDVSEPIDLEALPTVTLKGTVYAKLDETKPSGVYDLVPQGKLVVRVSVPYRAYDPNNTSEGYYVKEATITGDGTYEVAVPYVSSGVTAIVSFMDFTHEVKVQNPVGQETTVLKHFTCDGRVVPVLGSGRLIEGDYIEIDGQYKSNAVNPNDEDGLSPTKNVSVSGKLEYMRIDSNTLGNNLWDAVPSGTKVIAIITLTDEGSKEYAETKTVTVGSGGSYTVTVPMVERGTATISLHSEEFWEMTIAGSPDKKEMWRYVLSDTVTAYNVATQTGKDLRYKEKNKI